MGRRRDGLQAEVTDRIQQQSTEWVTVGEYINVQITADNNVPVVDQGLFGKIK